MDESARYLVAIAPARYDRERLSLRECREAIAQSRVTITGWAMPFYARDVATGPGYIFERTDLAGIVHHVEEWRLYRSGQFVHRSIPFERLDTEFEQRARAIADWNPRGGGCRSANVTGFLSFVTLIYFVTQTFAFAARLADVTPYDDGNVRIYVGLRNVENFALGSNDVAHRLFSLYRVRMDAPGYSVRVPRVELIADPAACALTALGSIFEQFNWDPQRSMPTIVHHQRLFLRDERSE